MGINLSNTRHIFLTQNISFRKSNSTNYPLAEFTIGAAFTPKNKNYKITNLSITQSDIDQYTDATSYFTTFFIYHRFFGTDDPVIDFANSLPSGYDLSFNGSPYNGEFSFQDQNDSQNIGYNKISITNTNFGQSSLNCTNVKTNTKHESIPITKTLFSNDLKNFYFNSGTNNFLAFCIFPNLNFYDPGNLLVFNTNYSINFDLIQE